MKIKKVGFHVLFWLFLIVSFAISEWNYRDTFIDAIVFEILFLPSRLIAVYVNWFYLIPFFLLKNRFINYSLYTLFLLVSIAIFQRIFVMYVGYPIFFPEWVLGKNIPIWRLTSIVQIILMIATPVGITTGWKLFLDLKQKEKKAKILEKEKIATQLDFLKSQINPHFLFNTLNTIYGLSIEKSIKTPELILRLSDFLSFSLYESNQPKIPLQKEISLLMDFLNLQKARFDERMKLKIEISNNIDSSIFLPPLLLVPFVENACKHSLTNESKIATIEIKLEVLNNHLQFFVQNSIPNHNQFQSNNKGLGLQNIQKRLELIYQKSFVLEISKTIDMFTVKLQLPL